MTPEILNSTIFIKRNIAKRLFPPDRTGRYSFAVCLIF